MMTMNEAQEILKRYKLHLEAGRRYAAILAEKMPEDFTGTAGEFFTDEEATELWEQVNPGIAPEFDRESAREAMRRLGASEEDIAEFCGIRQ
jgi:hypothetical protein